MSSSIIRTRATAPSATAPAPKAKKLKTTGGGARDRTYDSEPEGEAHERAELDALAARWKNLDFATKKKEHRKRMRWIARRLKVQRRESGTALLGHCSAPRLCRRLEASRQ